MKPVKRLLLLAALMLLVFSLVGCSGPAQTQTAGQNPAGQNPAEENPGEDLEEPSREPEAEAGTSEVTVPTEPPAAPPEQTDETEPPEAGESTSTAGPLLAADCSTEGCSQDGNFLLGAPVPADRRNAPDHSNRFASYQKRTKDVHHGVDFLNSTGTPVLAAADGVVIVAGDDSQIPFALHKNTYGNLIVIEHSFPGVAEPVYTLYGHLSEIKVSKDETVAAGQEIGLVGMSGNVNGSTLHFEVRYGENSFASVQNPELWLQPLPDENGEAMGAIAGRIIDSDGNFIKVENIVLERLAGPGLPAIDQYYVKTYAEKRLTGNPVFGENFALGSLPAGDYQITFMMNGVQQKVVTVEAGKLTLVTFQIEG